MASSSRLPHNTLDPYDDEDYDSDPSRPQTPTIHPYPIFHTTDPALRFAYSFGDPRGGTYPEPPTPHGPPPGFRALEVSHSDEEAAESDDDDDDAEDYLGDPMILDGALLDVNDARRDPDYRRSDESEGSGPETETESKDSREALEVMSDEEPIGGRGRPRGRPRGSRGRGRGRGRPRGRGRGRGRGGAGEGRAGAYSRDNPPPQVFKRVRKRAEPSAEFKQLNAKVTQAWIKQDYDTALHYGLQAVKLNPDVFELHGTIAEILIKQGRKEDAIGALYTGVHASKKPENWWYVANRLDELGDDSKETRDKMMYCYTTILKLNGDDLQARKLRMKGYREEGLLARARNDAKRLLQADPADFEVLRHLAELSAGLDEPEEAAPYFRTFIEKCMEDQRPGDTHLTWESLNWFIDTLLEAKEYEDALRRLNTVSRWLLGRSDETYWDDMPDDREWDPNDEPRRVQVPQYFSGNMDIEKYGEALPMELRVKLGIIRLGLGKEHLEEALHHLEFLESEDEAGVLDYADLFRDAGDALQEAGHYELALRFYEPLKDKNLNLEDSSFFFDLALCYHALGRKEELSKCFEAVKRTTNGRDPHYQLGLARLYRAMGREDLMWQLIRVLKKAGKKEMVKRAGLPMTRPESLGAVADEMDDEDEQSEGDETPVRRGAGGSASKAAEYEDDELAIPFRKAMAARGPYRRRRRAKLSEQEEAEKDYVAGEIYAQIQALSEDVAKEDPEAIEQWIQHCSDLFDDFKSQSVFFVPEKYIPFQGFKRTKQIRIPDVSTLLDNPSIEFEIPTDYRTIHFDDWVDLLMAYAIQLAKLWRPEQCWEVIDVAEDANIFVQDEERFRVIKTAGLTCALILSDDKRLCERCRWFIKTYPYQSDVYRLYSIVNRCCKGPLTWYNAGPEQKFLLRQIKMMDFALLDDEQRTKFKWADGEVVKWTKSGNTDGNPHGITEHDAALLGLYGHVMLVAGSYANALVYYFRAYALVPNDVVLNLYIAVAYVGIAFKRQTYERQYMIQQGLSFLQKYYELRTKDGIAIHMQEAEFNMALMWHKVGVLHLALKCYEKVLELSERVQMEGRKDLIDDEVVEDFAVDAAFAIQTILALGGDFEGARRICEKWLVI